MTDWNYADVWETVADVQPDLVAITQGARNVTLAGVRPRAPTAWPGSCSTSGVAQQDKVAVYLYNSPEYLQATFAAMKVGLVPVNTNYRYGDDELSYLWDNADAVAVVFHGAFAERIEGILERVPSVQGLAVGRRRLAARAPTGPPPTTTPAKSAIGTGARPVGPQRRRPLHALHRRHDRDAQGRDVAPGRPLRPAHRRRRAPLRRRRRARRGARRARGEPGRRHLAAGLPAHARDRAPSPPTPRWPRAGGSASSSRRQYDPVELLDTDRAREGERPRHRRRPVLAPAAGRARRATRVAGT